jgi:hypothetical protein
VPFPLYQPTLPSNQPAAVGIVLFFLGTGNCNSPVYLRFPLLLWLKPGYACDVIGVVTEFMVDVAGVEAWLCVCFNSMPQGLSLFFNFSYRKLHAKLLKGSIEQQD